MQKIKFVVSGLLLLYTSILGATTRTHKEIDMHFTSEKCMANAIYYEAGNQSTIGKAAIGRVILNRVNAGKSGGFSGNVCGVVYQGAGQRNCQFRFACKRQRKSVNKEQYLECERVAQGI